MNRDRGRASHGRSYTPRRSTARRPCRSSCIRSAEAGGGAGSPAGSHLRPRVVAALRRRGGCRTRRGRARPPPKRRPEGRVPILSGERSSIVGSRIPRRAPGALMACPRGREPWVSPKIPAILANNVEGRHRRRVCPLPRYAKALLALTDGAHSAASRAIGRIDGRVDRGTVHLYVVLNGRVRGAAEFRSDDERSEDAGDGRS